MKETVRLGQVDCDFLTPAQFEKSCDHWLDGNDFHHVVTLNPEMIMLAERDTGFSQTVGAAELRVPDGVGLVWARWYLRSTLWPLLPSLLTFLRQRVERVTGVDSVMTLARLCQQKGLPLYLLGSTHRQRQKTAQKLKKRFPGLETHMPPDGITECRPAALLVAYGAPKQTIWIEKNRYRLTSVRIAAGVGGAFAMLSEELPRAPAWLRKINLEWLWRLYLEPRRLPRIWQAVVRFPWLIKKQKTMR